MTRTPFPRLMVIRMLFVIGSLSVTLCALQAGGDCCDSCGHVGHCHKICRLVCEQKKVTVTCWGCKSEDFCLPGPSQPGCKHCDWVCDEQQDPKSPCVQSKKFVWRDWSPNCCAKLHTKNKLMKRTITKTIPSYKWVVEDLCPTCQAACQAAANSAENQPLAGAEIPPRPKVADATVIAPVPAAPVPPPPTQPTAPAQP